jgi:hypothetical protein
MTTKSRFFYIRAAAYPYRKGEYTEAYSPKLLAKVLGDRIPAHGGYTVLIQSNANGKVHIGASQCHIDDNFNKASGRAKALEFLNYELEFIVEDIPDILQFHEYKARRQQGWCRTDASTGLTDYSFAKKYFIQEQATA